MPRQELRRVVLTHFHDDHAGGAADVVGWSGATVAVGRADAPYVRGDEPGPFNLDRGRAWTSLQRLAALDVEVAGLGHGQPIGTGAARAMLAAADVFA
jgi:phosphoribosyl 1,2-cyclic phosphodiesterase